MDKGFRFAVAVAVAAAATTLVLAWIYDLPVRDPDSVAGPTYLRLPVILLVAFLIDVVPRAMWRARSPLPMPVHLASVVKERWTVTHVRFVLVGLASWYLVYVSFRNLKSFVPFVNRHLWDGWLEDIDRLLWFGNDPAGVLHDWFGTDLAAHLFSTVYIAWLVLVPASLVVALVWSRDSRAGVWYVTAIAVDWVLGAAAYFAVPSLGPAYARPELFDDIARTDVTGLQKAMMAERHEVLVNPFTADSVQTIAAFASLHVGLCVTMCLMAELLRLHPGVRLSLWVFLGLTALATVYLGWHYFLDVVAGAVLGVAGVWIAARGTGNNLRRGSNDHPPEAISRPSRVA